ncbi:5-methylthioadenosine/S-adenosylhomocysteine deaminase [Anaerobacterium chartisolvens]|uniref:5-methylthioadenosine/S-adenosylhomocysteine deaminase n=1 Tax=Anaerobacterium chartisolvens TaxID=1297424 RepID=A0A369B6N1_9FIRM|nr:amidohydrolase [Anaerobacterium chartisolvens]RCX17163.1 5-methylthioadenosine/S-adenosylhomocysteine deaminase [Anaerobacterium chartisolvens]
MNILLKNMDIITGDALGSCIKDGNVAIKDGIIYSVGKLSELADDFKPEKIIDGKNRLAMPGLVNAHTHSPMTVLRNFADDLSLEEWLFNKIIPAEGLLSPEDIYWGCMLGIIEMIKSGTTCFADMYLHMDEVAQAVMESGIRANISKGPLVSGVRGNPGISVDEEGCTGFFNRWHNNAGGRIKVYVEIHSVYLFDEGPLREAAALARQLGTGIHIHVLETLAERETSIKKYGLSPVGACLEFGIFDVPVIAAHCVHPDADDLDVLCRKKVNVVHNPTSNLKLGSGIAPIPDMVERGINVCLGTDGAASNNNLNMFEEMNLAALIHKGRSMNPMLINAGEALRMAAVNGASALGFHEETGCIKKGMKADLIILDTDKPHLCPMNNPLSAVVYSAQASDVCTVIVDGTVLMENGELKTIDREKAMYEVEKTAKRILHK